MTSRQGRRVILHSHSAAEFTCQRRRRTVLYASSMKMMKFAALCLIAFGMIAANDVAPSNAELEAMYDKAYRAFDASDYAQALQELDAIDARKPDLAASQNLRGVIYMRQGAYDKAETALLEAQRLDPKFWNARFNLAEIPFLKKDWPEARKRFQELLTSNGSELDAEAAQLIQYKILLTYLLEGNETTADAILAKLELSPNTPAVHYSNAAIALQHQNAAEAKSWMTAAQKNFSPQLNKLFAESLYAVGWLERQPGQTRPAVQLLSTEERAAQAKSAGKSQFDEAEQAFEQRDFDTAAKLAEQADAADPQQPATLNLRGAILLEQKQFDEAEAFFRKALKIDPKFREAQFNLAEVPFRQKEFARARERFQTLLKQTPGGEKNQAWQLINFKIFMTYLLEDKDSRAQKMMEEFQFSGDTPALYYAQAAWEFQHNNSDKADDWVASARKIYPLGSNAAYSSDFYDLGWLKNAAVASSPSPSAAALASSQNESAGPAIEPSPIPESQPRKDTSLQLASATPVPAPGAEIGPKAEALTSQTTPGVNLATIAPSSPASQPQDIPASGPSDEAAAPVTAEANVATGDNSPTPMAAEQPSTANSVPQESANVVANTPAEAVPSPSAAPSSAVPPNPTPTEARSPTATVPQASLSERLDRWTDPRTLIVGALLLGALGLLWFLAPQIRRLVASHPAPAEGPPLDMSDTPGAAIGLEKQARFSGGPRRVSLQLTPSARPRILQPFVERVGTQAAKPEAAPVDKAEADVPESDLRGDELSHTPVGEQPQATGDERLDDAREATRSESVAQAEEHAWQEQVAGEGDSLARLESAAELSIAAVEMPSARVEPSTSEGQALAENALESAVLTDITAQKPSTVEAESETMQPELSGSPILEAETVEQRESLAPSSEDDEIEPVAQGQPVPYQTVIMPEESNFMRTVPYREDTEGPTSNQPAIMPEPAVEASGGDFSSQPTTHSMPETVHTSATPSVGPSITPMPPPPAPQTMLPHAESATPATAAGMHTAVQLTLSCEITSMQLTPSFKMGALQLRPMSNVVTMRLASGQQQQHPMNLQVNFEISKVQPGPGSLGQMRLIPSQQQRPAAANVPSLHISGMQLVSGFGGAPVQLTPSQQGQASVHLTAAFQIASVEFSPRFEVAAIILNASSNSVSVQLPGASDTEPTFEITNVQVASNGEIGMLQLHPLGSRPI